MSRVRTEGIYRDTVIRNVTDVPVVGHPVRLRVCVPRDRCITRECSRVVFASHNTIARARHMLFFFFFFFSRAATMRASAGGESIDSGVLSPGFHAHASRGVHGVA
ncbi:hypothetical protein OG921_04780 [Aldersonia sp. NBC_00410]|uniref:hypothetical protein n=1 Tax=Aldersonia sp. NBC_00410 TaxID=2975954 RepID=UPI00225502C5|nr:hypothetical protein [Aldersonia sp. NBC_00410]MCX5042487.1 hypothetical protein [Aldersonia sp. NBC_00410]